ncbi:hypothetical protein D9Q98_004204 [Chlorella vulgaris]|uniref:tRNA (guanine-N(7)-)-methyltransferase non-catalytic subunit n=1 Tax=Chlorella vulgaris TaxID=3077 RepID=A0A9D4TRW9_CHLVU|nr:hypothetical protein D9Q98_004204 [Chlorella vulgaris]
MGRKHKNAAAREAGGKGAGAGRDDQQQQEAQSDQFVDPPKASIASHPDVGVAIACGLELRVYDARTQQHRSLVTKPAQPEPVQKGARPAPPYLRGVVFDAAGRYLLAGSEDKAAGLRVWDCSSWQLIQTIKVPKKVTAIAFTSDGAHVLAADKFGDVLVADTQRPAGLPEGQQQEPEVLLGHYCAILTSLALSSGGRFLATTDRDQRARVSVMPADPLAGAHEIQSFCLGHTAFVSCSTFVKQSAEELLVTGGGDGTLRLWDPLNGELLHTLELPPMQQPGLIAGDTEQEGAAAEGGSSDEDMGGEADTEAGAGAAETGADGAQQEADGGQVELEGDPAAANGGQADSNAAVPLALAASPCGTWLVAAVDGRDQLCLLRLDWDRRQLQEHGWHSLSGLHLPACLSFDGSGRLWAAGGPVVDDSAAAFVACGSIAPAGLDQDGQDARLVDGVLPEWLPAAAVQQLEAKAGNEEELLAATQQRRLASQILKKRQHSLQQLKQHTRKRRAKEVAAEARALAKQAEQTAEPMAH